MSFERVSWVVLGLMGVTLASVALWPDDAPPEHEVLAGAALAPPEVEPTPLPAPRAPVLRARADRVPRAPAAPPPREPWHRLGWVPAATLDKLGRTRGWRASVRAFYGLPEATDDEAALARLSDLLDDVEDPVVRQNVIFHVALAVPWDVAGPWLEAVAFGTGDAPAWSAADREDALVALAFSGAPDAMAAFAALARTPARAIVHQLVDRMADHERIGTGGGDGARATLRSYRAVEVLDRAPYFKTLAFEAPLTWTTTGAPTADDRAARTLEALWLARYPGHPGSDDLALRIARRHLVAGQHEDAARWFARAASLPDQDVTQGAVRGLLSVAELLLTPAQVEALAFEAGDDTPNHELLVYVHVRRLAAEVGYDAAVAAMDDVARSESAETLAFAWRRRWLADPPRGLASGRSAIAPSDPLRRGGVRFDGDAPDPGPLERPPPSTPPDPEALARRARLEPDREAVALDTDRLETQFRLWETLAELERRAEAARGAERADLLYKLAAVHYHQVHTLFPQYGRATHGFRDLLGGLSWEGRPEPAAVAAAHARFERTSYALLRAIARFDGIEREHPADPLLDRVRFSRAMAWHKLTTFRPWISPWPDLLDGTTNEGRAIRAAVADFETVARSHPESALADDAAAAATYWRAWLQRSR